MADLKIKLCDTYNSILTLNSGNVSGTAKGVTDGDNNTTALEVSTTKVRSTGDLESDGDATVSGTVTAGTFSGSGSGLTDIARAEQDALVVNDAGNDESFKVTDSVALVTAINNLNLADAANYGARMAYFKDTGGSGFTLDASAGNNIDGSGTKAVAANEGYILYCDGIDTWHIMAKFS